MKKKTRWKFEALKDPYPSLHFICTDKSEWILQNLQNETSLVAVELLEHWKLLSLVANFHRF